MKNKKLQKLSFTALPDGQKNKTEAITQDIKQKIATVSQMLADNPYVLYSSLIVALGLTVFYYPYVKVDYDIWYHLKFGEHFVTNRTFSIDHSVFSWTPADPEWKYGIWLGSSFLYLLHSFAGVYGLELFKWLILASSIGLYLAYCRRAEQKIDINNITIMLLLAVVLNAIASMVKPDNFTLLFFALIVFIYFSTKSYFTKTFYFFPLIFLVWVNTHGGFLVGLFFLTLVLSGEALNFYLKKKDAFPKKLMLEFAVSVFFSYAATLINPYGISYHIYTIPTYFKSGIMGYAGTVFAFQSLWKFIFTDYFRLANALWGLLLLLLFFIGLCVHVFRQKKMLDPGLIAANLVFFYIGSNTSRVAAFSAIVTAFSISYVIKKGDALLIKRNMAVISAVIFIIMSSVIFYDSLTKVEYREWVATDSALPAKETDFIKRYKLPQPVFNDYLIGGYMIWSMYPEYKVFIDPRYGPYWRETGPDYFNFLSGATAQKLKAFNQKYPFKTAFILYAQSALMNLFMLSDDWKLVYFGDMAAVFVRKDALDEISRDALTVDISAGRFERQTDPLVLNVLFIIYSNLNFVKYGEEIIAIYEKNVSSFYKWKQTDIAEMKKFLNTVRLRMYQQNNPGRIMRQK